MNHRPWIVPLRRVVLCGVAWTSGAMTGWSQSMAIPLSTLSRPGVVIIQQSGWLLKAHALGKSQTWLEHLESADPGYRIRLQSHRVAYERQRSLSLERDGEPDSAHPSYGIATAMVGVFHRGWTVAMPEVVFADELAKRTAVESGNVLMRLPLPWLVEVSSDLSHVTDEDPTEPSWQSRVVALQTRHRHGQYELPRRQVVSIGRLLSREPLVSGTGGAAEEYDSARFEAIRKEVKGLVLVVERIDSKLGPLRIIVPEILDREESGAKSVVHCSWLLDPYHSIPLLANDKILLTDWNTLATLAGLPTLSFAQVNRRASSNESSIEKQHPCIFKKVP